MTLLFKNVAPTNGAAPPGSGDAQQEEKVLIFY
jgi:hypothetical protein